MINDWTGSGSGSGFVALVEALVFEIGEHIQVLALCKGSMLIQALVLDCGSGSG